MAENEAAGERGRVNWKLTQQVSTGTIVRCGTCQLMGGVKEQGEAEEHQGLGVLHADT